MVCCGSDNSFFYCSAWLGLFFEVAGVDSPVPAQYGGIDVRMASRDAGGRESVWKIAHKDWG